MLNRFRTPMALVAEGFLAGALVFAAVNPSLLHHDTRAADAKAAALVQELVR